MTETSTEMVPTSTSDISTQPKRSRKWLVLFVFSWVAGINQFCWLNLSPIISDIQDRFHVSDALITLILMVFPFVYVIFSYHAGRMIDIRGYRFAICYGCAWTAIFSLLRMWSSFQALLVAQIGIAIGQPYIVNAICKLVMDWFPAEQTALATGLGTVGIFLCEVFSLAISAPIYQAVGYVQAMGIFSSVTWIACISFFLFGTRANKHTSCESSLSTSIGPVTFWKKAASRNIILLFIGSFLGLGYFYALTDWIVPILATQGLNADQAGYVGGTLMLGGIFGSIIITALADHFGHRKPFLMGTMLLGGITMVPLLKDHKFLRLLIWGFIHGFFFLPAYPLLLDMTSIQVGVDLTGSATGIIQLAGNLGGVIMIVSVGALKGSGEDIPSAFSFLMSLIAAGFVVSSCLKPIQPQYQPVEEQSRVNEVT